MKKITGFFFALLLLFQLGACGQNTPTWEEQYDLGVRYLSEGNYDEAIIAFTAAIEIDPKRAEAYVGRGDAYIGSGETEENLVAALSDYQTALELASTQANIYLRIADCYVAMGDIPSAVEILKVGIAETDASELKSRLEEYESQLLPEEITVLTKQSYVIYEYLSRGDYGDDQEFRESYSIYEYDSNGYLIHQEDWFCDHSPWSSESDQWALTRSVDYTYNAESKEWVETEARRYDGEFEPVILKHYSIGTHDYTTGASGGVSITCDPYPEEKSDFIYNPEYGDKRDPQYDWYSAKYTYDVNGNAIKIESYSIDGLLLGVCELEYRTIQLK